MMPYLFGKQKTKANGKHINGQHPLMMFLVTMPQSKDSYYKSDGNHSIFKHLIVNDIDAKQREAGEEQRQQRTVNGAGNRGGDTQRIPIYFVIKHRTKIVTATLLQNICFL